MKTTALKIIFIFSLCIFFFSHGNQLSAQTLHAIIFAGNNDIKETLRQGISRSRDDMRQELKKVASTLQLNYNELIADGDHFNEQNLFRAINRLNPEQDDIVFFYFIGHGINKPEIDSKWPQLAFQTNYDDNSSKLISFSEIVRQLEEKMPRLLIAFAEACNATSGRTEYYQEDILGLASLSFTERDKERLKDLYIRSEGTVISSSSEMGQKSYVSRRGGYFSSSFIEVQKELTSMSSFADWETLMGKTKSRTSTLAGIDRFNPKKQIPQYVVNVRGIRRPEFSWQNQINKQENVYETKPNNFNYNTNYKRHQQFLVAKIVFFANQHKVYFVMPDNYITEYNPYTGLLVAGYRTMPAEPQFFQWDIISYYSPFHFNRWGVDYYGRIMEWHPNYGWQFVGIVYY